MAATALVPVARAETRRPAGGYVPGRVVVAYVAARPGRAHAADLRSRGDRAEAVNPDVVRLPRGESVPAAIGRLRRQPDVAYAVPDYVAHVADAGWFPDDPGRKHVRGAWKALQWNFLSRAGVNAPQAWANLRADGHPGGRGAVVAILDTGVAYRNWRRWRRSPDFTGTRFVAPYDFVDHNRYPLDREGHGTFVAGTIAEQTNNGYGLTGLAYGASIMPVRVLDTEGNGDAVTIADGIRYATRHRAQVINLSLEFTPDVTAADIPEIISAIRYASRHGVVVVAAAGNEGVNQIAYPARAATVISVGATTRDRCLADYSNTGERLDLVAPGGGDDLALPGDTDCHPDRNLPSIYQMTFGDPAHPGRFGFPGGMFGTSMSTPHVSAAAALVIASRVIGRHPAPQAILERLEKTAQPLGGAQPNQDFGYGLVDAGAATERVISSSAEVGPRPS